MDLLIFYHGQCVPVNKNVWDQQLEKYRQKSPSTIELLKETQCQELEIDGVCVDLPGCFRYIKRTMKLLLGNSLITDCLDCLSLKFEPIYTYIMSMCMYLFLTSFGTLCSAFSWVSMGFSFY